MHPSKVRSGRSAGIQEDLCKKNSPSCWAFSSAAVRRITIVIRRTAAFRRAQHGTHIFLHKSSWMPTDRQDPILLGCILLQSFAGWQELCRKVALHKSLNTRWALLRKGVLLRDTYIPHRRLPLDHSRERPHVSRDPVSLAPRLPPGPANAAHIPRAAVPLGPLHRTHVPLRPP